MLLSASFPSICQLVGSILADGVRHLAIGCSSGEDGSFAVVTVGRVVALGFAVGVKTGVDAGAGVEVADEPDGPGGAGIVISGVTESSWARMTPAELGRSRLRTSTTTTSRRIVCLDETSTIMRTGAECCR